MVALSNSLVLSKSPALLSLSGSSLKSTDQHIGTAGFTNLSFSLKHAGKSSTSKRKFTVQAGYSDGGRTSSSSIFVGGFLLGGLVVGTMGCIYAPQISKALAGADKKDLMRKLPRFIYDEEKALERQRKILSEKIEQLNSAIDDVSTQLRSEDTPDGAVVNSNDLEPVV